MYASDSEFIESWLGSKSPNTVKAYRLRIERLLEYTGKTLKQITLPDLQNFVRDQRGEDNTIRLTINTIRSLFSFGTNQGYLAQNFAFPIKPLKPKDRLAERMLSAEDIDRIVANTKNERDRILIWLMYITGGRVSELCGMQWRDVKKNGKSGQVTLFGKGRKTRAVKLPENEWQELLSLKGDAKPSDPVFRSRKKSGHLDPSHAWRIVRGATIAAGIDANVSPHWFRHSHASHALERGANPMLVRDTLGHSNLSVTDRYAHANPSQSSSSYLGKKTP